MGAGGIPPTPGPNRGKREKMRQGVRGKIEGGRKKKKSRHGSGERKKSRQGVYKFTFILKGGLEINFHSDRGSRNSQTSPRTPEKFSNKL